jgi:hypothetical protein
LRFFGLGIGVVGQSSCDIGLFVADEFGNRARIGAAADEAGVVDAEGQWDIDFKLKDAEGRIVTGRSVFVPGGRSR